MNWTQNFLWSKFSFQSRLLLPYERNHRHQQILNLRAVSRVEYQLGREGSSIYFPINFVRLWIVSFCLCVQAVTPKSISYVRSTCSLEPFHKACDSECISEWIVLEQWIGNSLRFELSHGIDVEFFAYLKVIQRYSRNLDTITGSY